MDINRYLKLFSVHKQIEVIVVALNLKIFKLLKQDNHSFHSLSKLLNSDPRNTKILLDSLVLLELLYKDGDIYKNEKISEKYFTFDSKEYCGDIFLNRNEMSLYEKSMIDSLVKNGSIELQELKHPNVWASSAKKFLRQEQEHLTANAVIEIIKNLKEFKDMKKMLELGCSSGAVGLEIVKNHPSIQGVLYDFDAVTQVTNENIKDYGLENRVISLGG